MPGGTALLIVDPQRDFHEGGSLAVPGAIEDAGRIAQLITSQAEHIDELIVTLDSHHVSLQNTYIQLGAVWGSAHRCTKPAAFRG